MNPSAEIQIRVYTVETWIPCTLRSEMRHQDKAVFEHEAGRTMRQSEWVFQ